MSKAKPLTRIHKKAELLDSFTPQSTKRKQHYIRDKSPRITRGQAGFKSDNIRGRFSEPDAQLLEDIKNDPELRARVQGRRNKLTAKARALKKA